MKVEMRPIESVTPYERNPRVNAGAVDAVAASMREFGVRQPIVVDEQGIIIVGHTRLMAAQKLGLKEVPVHVATGLTPAQVKAYRLADNAVADRSDWNLDLLPLELRDLQGMDFDLDLLGFAPEELEQILGAGVHGNEGLTDPDAIPEPPDEAVTQQGDLWILGDHRLLCGDSAKPEDVDRLLGGAKIQLVNTDPPYNVRVEPRSNNAIAVGLSSFPATEGHHQKFDLERHPEKAQPTSRKLRPRDRPLENDFVSEEKFDGLLAAWFGNIARVLEPGRGFYIWGGFSNCGNYPPVLKASGLYFSQAIIWVKGHPVLTRKDFMTAHEWCFHGWREGAAHQFFGRANVRDVWEVSRAGVGAVAVNRGVRLEGEDGSRIDVLPPVTENLPAVRVGTEGIALYGPNNLTDVWFVRKVSPQKMVHLTEKPVELAARAMAYSSRPGENVLDLFGGSGSTLIAAERTGRRAFLMEIDALYCDVICDRWSQYTGKKAERISAGGTA